MVTNIIKNEDINPCYMNINDWITDGITNDAVLVLRNQSSQIIAKYDDLNLLRNKFDPFNNFIIQPVNKW